MLKLNPHMYHGGFYNWTFIGSFFINSPKWFGTVASGQLCVPGDRTDKAVEGGFGSEIEIVTTVPIGKTDICAICDPLGEMSK